MKKESHLTVKEWNEDDQPREKLLRQGRKSLSNAELLAILLRSGANETSVVSLAQRILSRAGNSLVTLSRTEAAVLMKEKGVGAAKATGILAAMELGIRLSNESMADKRHVINSTEDMFHYIAPKMIDLPVEEFWTVYLNNRNHVLGTHRIAQGGLTHTAVDVRLIFKGALECNAVALIIAHNHPSGSLRPSKDDDLLTQRVNEVGKLMQIRLHDHLIIGRDESGTENYFSYLEEGRL